jgi:predicted transcriptional regulator
MASKTKTREVTIVDEGGAFRTFFKKFTGENSMYDFEGISTLRKMLSNQKLRVLHTLKVQKPKSMYELAKFLGRDFKSVSEDIKLLERFGFIDIVSEQSGKRKRLRPVLAVDSVSIHVKI